MNEKTSVFVFCIEAIIYLLYNLLDCTFKELMEIDGSIQRHIRNSQTLATEKFKIYDNIAPPFFTKIFNKHNINYKLCHSSDFSFPNIRSIYYETQSLSFLGPTICHIVTTMLK